MCDYCSYVSSLLWNFQFVMFPVCYEISFLENYQEYCKSWELREDTFNMTHKEEGNLEDYVECFQSNLHRYPHNTLGGDILKTILIWGMRDEWLDMVNIVVKDDISKEIYETIYYLWKIFSWGDSISKLGIKDFSNRAMKLSNGGVTYVEIGILLKDFKTDILNTLSSQLYFLQGNKRQIWYWEGTCYFLPTM